MLWKGRTSGCNKYFLPHFAFYQYSIPRVVIFIALYIIIHIFELTPDQLKRLDDKTKIQLGFPHDFMSEDSLTFLFGKSFSLIDNHRAKGLWTIFLVVHIFMSYSFKRIWDNVSNKVIVMCLWLSNIFISTNINIYNNCNNWMPRASSHNRVKERREYFDSSH